MTSFYKASTHDNRYLADASTPQARTYQLEATHGRLSLYPSTQEEDSESNAVLRFKSNNEEGFGSIVVQSGDGDIPVSDLVFYADDDEKSTNRSKFNKHNRSKKGCKNKSQQQLERQIEATREGLRTLRLRVDSKNPKEVCDLADTLKKLHTKKNIMRIKAHSGTMSDSLPAFLSKIQYFIEYVKTAGDTIGKDVLDFLVDVFTTLYNIYNNTSWTSISINLTSFISRHFPEHYVNYVFDCFTAIFDVITAQSYTDSARDFFQGLFDKTDDIVNDELWDNISSFFVKIVSLYGSLAQLVSFETLDLPTIIGKFKEFKKTIPHSRDLIETAFAAFEFIFGHWEQVVTGNWSVFFLGKDQAKSFETEVRLLENAFTFAISNHEVELLDRFSLTLEQFEVRLENAIKKGEKMASHCTSTQQKMAISNFMRTLCARRTEWYARLADAPSRMEPFGLKMSGPSSCGKSMMCTLLSKVMMEASGIDPNQKGSTVFTNISEKFESTIKPSHKIIVCDDVANNKNEKPNYDRILNYVNTVPRPLEKADVADKGKLYPGNCGLLVTTNVEDLGATKHSNCAESILRRFGLHVKVTIREPFRNSYGGLKKQQGMRFDVYELELCTFSHILDSTQESPELSSLEDLEGPAVCRTTEQGVVWNIIPRSEWVLDGSDDKDFPHLCAYLAKAVRSHRIAQTKQMETKAQLDGGAFCSHCNVPSIVCVCANCTTTQDEAEDEVPVMDMVPPPEEVEETVDEVVAVPSTEDEEISAHLGGGLAALSTATLWHLKSAMAGSKNSCIALYKDALFWRVIFAERHRLSKILFTLLGLPFISLLFGRRFALASGAVTCISAYLLHRAIQRRVDETLTRRLDYLSSLCVTTKNHLKNNVLTYCTVGASFYALYTAYTLVKPLLTSSEDRSTYLDRALPVFNQIVKKPTSEHRVRTEDERDYKEGYSRLPPKMSKPAATTTAADLHNMIRKMSRVVVVKSQGQMFGTVNGLMVAGNVIMVPSHIIPDTDLFDIETTSTPHVPSAKTKDQKITRSMVWTLPSRDLSLVHLPSAPPSRDFLEFFPETEATFRSRATVCIFKSHDGEIFESRQPIRPYYDSLGRQSLTYVGMKEKPGTFYGVGQRSHLFTIDKPFTAQLEFQSFEGLCGSPYVDIEKALIYGFHVAGYTSGSNTGWLTSITKPMLQDGLKHLHDSSHALVLHSAGPVNIDPYGTGYTIKDSKPLYVREDGLGAAAVVTYMGKVEKNGLPLESRARVPYIPTPYKGVVENLGQCEHIPPTKPNDVGKSMKTLNKLHDPVQHYEHDVLKQAVDDYRDQTLKCIRAHKEELVDVLRFYSQEEAMDGTHDGQLCGLPNATSAGYGIDKSKKKVLQKDPFDEELVKIPREFSEDFDVQGEIDRTLDCWSKNLRSEPIYKASSKVNELLPIKKAKDKVRKFYGSPFANFVASRRVLGGVPIFMRRFWRETECLVGINPMSSDWESFEEYVSEYTKTHMLAGDFSGFDTRMAAQITSAAANVMVSWYREMGLSKEELTLLKGALSDIITPNILFDGDLYRFANGNPSGNLITVQLNSICNSLMMRYVYYKLNRRVKKSFSQNVKLGTYGDDNAMGVKEDCTWFNHTACQREFAEVGVGYTMADKDADSVPYIPLSKVSFLKREFRTHPELGKTVAPIEEASILKKFHFVKKPSESPLSFDAQFGSYTDGAFREAYLHGRDFYNEFSSKIRNIVDLNPSLKTHVSFITYEDMKCCLAEAYEPGGSFEPRKLFAESVGIDVDDLPSMFNTE